MGRGEPSCERTNSRGGTGSKTVACRVRFFSLGGGLGPNNALTTSPCPWMQAQNPPLLVKETLRRRLRRQESPNEAPQHQQKLPQISPLERPSSLHMATGNDKLLV